MRALFAEALRIVLPLLIIGAAVGGFMVLGQRDAPAQRVSEDAIPAVETAPIEAFGDSFILRAHGVALPVRRLKLSSEVDGRIVSKKAAALGGRAVAPGTPLFEIDATNYNLRVKALQTQLSQADAELVAVDVEMASAQALIGIAEETWQVQKRTLARTVSLEERDAVSDSQLDEARNAELIARNSLQTLKNRVAELEQKRKVTEATKELVTVQLEEAEEDLARTSVVSPIHGSIVSTQVEENDFVRRGDPLIEISDNGRMEVRCSLRADQLYWIWMVGAGPEFTAGQAEGTYAGVELPQLPARVIFDFGGERVAWAAKLWRYEGTGLDPQTRTVPSRLLVEHPDQPVPVEDQGRGDRRPPRMVSGMYVDIEVPITPPPGLLRIPAAGLRAGGQVWVVEDGVLRIEPVEVERSEVDYVLVRSRTLTDQHRVVISPLAGVRDEMAVRVLGETPAVEDQLAGARQ